MEAEGQLGHRLPAPSRHRRGSRSVPRQASCPPPTAHTHPPRGLCRRHRAQGALQRSTARSGSGQVSGKLATRLLARRMPSRKSSSKSYPPDGRDWALAHDKPSRALETCDIHGGDVVMVITWPHDRQQVSGSIELLGTAQMPPTCAACVSNMARARTPTAGPSFSEYGSQRRPRDGHLSHWATKRGAQRRFTRCASWPYDAAQTFARGARPHARQQSSHADANGVLPHPPPLSGRHRPKRRRPEPTPTSSEDREHPPQRRRSSPPKSARQSPKPTRTTDRRGLGPNCRPDRQRGTAGRQRAERDPSPRCRRLGSLSADSPT